MGDTKIQKPIKLTDEVHAKLEQAAALDATWPECAFYANISIRTLMYWLDSVEGLKERLQELREKPILKARNTIIKSLDDPKDAQWYLERKKKSEFSQRIETLPQGNIQNNFFVNTQTLEAAKQFEETLKNQLYVETSKETETTLESNQGESQGS